MAEPRVMTRKVDRVPVPCCGCGEPTAMRVPSALLDEIQIWHLCVSCFRSAESAPRVPGISERGKRPRLRAVRRSNS